MPLFRPPAGLDGIDGDVQPPAQLGHAGNKGLAADSGHRHIESEFIDITWPEYGAVSGTDCTAAIAAAEVDRAAANKKLFFPAGVWLSTGSSMTGSLPHWEGVGMGQSIIRGTGAHVPKLLDVQGADTPFTLKGLTLDGNAGGGTNTDYGLYLEDLAIRGNCSEVEITGCKGAPGLGLTNANRNFSCLFDRCWIHDNLVGAQMVQSCQQTVFDHCLIYANTNNQLLLGDDVVAIGQLSFHKCVIQMVAPAAAQDNVVFKSCSGPIIFDDCYFEDQGFAASTSLHFKSQLRSVNRCELRGCFYNGNGAANFPITIDAGVTTYLTLSETVIGSYLGGAGNGISDASVQSRYVRINTTENAGTQIIFRVSSSTWSIDLASPGGITASGVGAFAGGVGLETVGHNHSHHHQIPDHTHQEFYTAGQNTGPASAGTAHTHTYNDPSLSTTGGGSTGGSGTPNTTTDATGESAQHTHKG